MAVQFTFLIIPIFFAAVLTAFFAVMVIRRKSTPASLPLAAINIAVTVWSISYIMELISVLPDQKFLWLQIEYIGITTVPVFWLLFSYRYTHHAQILPKINLGFLFLVPGITMLLAFTNPSHNLIWETVTIIEWNQLLLFDLEYSFWFWVHTAYSYIMFLTGLYLLIDYYFQGNQAQRKQTLAIITAALFPALGNILYLTGINPIPEVDLTSLFFSATSVILVRILYLTDFLDIIPIARNFTIEKMVDGVLVINQQGLIVDSNPASRNILGFSSQELLSSSAAEVLDGILDWSRYQDSSRMSNFTLNLQDSDQEKIYQVRISPLSPESRNPLGHIVIFQDITETYQLNQNLQDQAGRLAVLYEVGKAMSATIEIDDLLELIYEQLRRVIVSDAYFVAIYNSEENILDLRVIIDQGNRFPPQQIPADQGLSSWIVENKQPLFIRDLKRDLDELPVKPIMMGEKKLSRSWLGVPLLVENQLLGILAVTSYQPDVFSEDDKQLLLQLAQTAALSIENARHHQEVEQQARLDSLTKVSNHSNFIDVLHQEAELSKSQIHPLSLIMLDIDHFKKYNDTYGHVVGDQVLKLTVQAIQSHIKKTDTVGRWGGEEFAVLLPNATTTQANMVANRIRHTLSELPLFDSEGNPIPKPTISQGIATYPDHSQNIDELVIIADRALYRAKDKGRDQVALGIPSSTGTAS